MIVLDQQIEDYTKRSHPRRSQQQPFKRQKAAFYKRIWKTKTIFNLHFRLKALAILCISRFCLGIQIFLKFIPAQEEHLKYTIRNKRARLLQML